MIKKFTLYFSLFLFQVCFAAQTTYIALVFDGEIIKSSTYVETIKKEIRDLLSNEYTIQFIDYPDQWNLLGAKQSLKQAYQDPQVNLVVTLGALTSFVALHDVTVTKPTVLGYDIKLLVEDPKTIKNPLIAYYESQNTLATKFKAFKDIAHVSHIAVIGDTSLIGLAEFPLIRQRIKKEAAAAGLAVSFIPIKLSAEQALPLMEKEQADGLFLIPTWRLKEEKFIEFIDEINKQKIPSFSFVGEPEVQLGVLMTMTPNEEIKRLARRLAINSLEMLTNGSSKDITVEFPQSEQIIINETTAKKIDLELSYKTLQEAKLIAKVRPSADAYMPMDEAVEYAVENNLDLDRERYVVKAGREDVLNAMAALLPQINSQAVARHIDSNTAKLRSGVTPQNIINGAFAFDQQIYDEDTWADYSIQKSVQNARIFQKEGVRLDVMLATSLAYLQILRTKAEREIAKENLDLTKANLKRAKELVQSGQARLSEVYRWESEQSTNQETLVELDARVENLQIAFNRLLNRSLFSEVYLEDINPRQSDFAMGFGNVVSYINTPKKFRLYKQFMVNNAHKYSPEIKQIDEEIIAQEREYTASKRSFYLPKFSAFGEASKNLKRGGAGSTPPPGLSNSHWSTAVGIRLSYPLVTGGARLARKNKAMLEVQRLKIQKASIVERIDERVMQSIDNMKSSYQSIYLSQISAEAGEKNLRIVTNSYERGVVSIVDLIDAQNTAIVAKRNHSNTIYDHLADLMILQRAVGEFFYFWDQDNKTIVKQELIKYLEMYNE